MDLYLFACTRALKNIETALSPGPPNDFRLPTRAGAGTSVVRCLPGPRGRLVQVVEGVDHGMEAASARASGG